MSTPPAGISAADWHSTPESVRDLVAQLQLLQQENEQLRPQHCRVHFARNLLQRAGSEGPTRHGHRRAALGVRRRLGRREPQFRNLADPPNLESCTRDVYAEGQQFSLAAGSGDGLDHFRRPPATVVGSHTATFMPTTTSITLRVVAIWAISEPPPSTPPGQWRREPV